MNPTPKLRSDVAIVEQVYRGEASFVVKDLETHKYFRFRPVEVTVMSGPDEGGFDTEGVYCEEVDSGTDFPVNQFNARLITPPSMWLGVSPRASSWSKPSARVAGAPSWPSRTTRT